MCGCPQWAQSWGARKFPPLARADTPSEEKWCRTMTETACEFVEDVDKVDSNELRFRDRWESWRKMIGRELDGRLYRSS